MVAAIEVAQKRKIKFLDIPPEAQIVAVIAGAAYPIRKQILSPTREEIEVPEFSRMWTREEERMQTSRLCSEARLRSREVFAEAGLPAVVQQSLRDNPQYQLLEEGKDTFITKIVTATRIDSNGLYRQDSAEIEANEDGKISIRGCCTMGEVGEVIFSSTQWIAGNKDLQGTFSVALQHPKQDIFPPRH